MSLNYCQLNVMIRSTTKLNTIVSEGENITLLEFTQHREKDIVTIWRN